MAFFTIYIQALLVIIGMMSLLWLVSIKLKNVSIVDPFWGFSFVLVGIFYFVSTDGISDRKLIMTALMVLWGLRLFLFLLWRNWGKAEDFRYQKFRHDYGADRYWWFSFFQVFLLQGVLLWLISAPLLASQFEQTNISLGIIDYLAIILWFIGFLFEAGGDYQMARFKANPLNKGKVLNKGFWKYTRHPNYFGDATVWWAFGLFSLSAGYYLPLLSSLLMSLLIIKVSGVSLLERTLKNTKDDYQEYIQKTNAFIPWFPKK